MGQCRTYPQKPLSKEGSEGLSVIVGGLGWARLVIPSHFWLVGWAMESLQFKEVRDWPWSSEKGRQAGPGKVMKTEKLETHLQFPAPLSPFAPSDF